MLYQPQPEQKEKEKKKTGRPPNRRAIIPPDHLGPDGLAKLIGVALSTLRGLIMRGDSRIPPRSPFAGDGPKQRQIWRVTDVAAHFGMSVAEIKAALAGEPQALTEHEPPLALPPAFFQPVQPAPAAQQAPQAKRKPGRPRGSGATLHVNQKGGRTCKR